ncbi:hypothetical protein [Burkholderia pseudomultivorans]|uniref:hypothetical protein n=1 Tax=Burkholderia pseudomultivorans TaxID=1207504 RepID=UPI0012D96AFB|nr:hypothetical protein [Burkholderia pseudomultivorans]
MAPILPERRRAPGIVAGRRDDDRPDKKSARRGTGHQTVPDGSAIDGSRAARIDSICNPDRMGVH